MLRFLVLSLLLANAGFFAWSQGLLAPLGFVPAQQSEPQRVEQQIKPDAVRILPGDEARRIELATQARPPECLQAGLFTDAESTTLKQSLEAWPGGSWTIEPAIEPGRWIVYMGKYADAAAVDKKRVELRGLNVSFEPLANPALEPGLSLGGYPSEAAARQQMQALTQKGVHTAKVVQERAAASGHTLKLAAVDDALRARLDDLKPALNGKGLRPCR